MAKVTGGQLIQRVLSKEGIKYIFGIPGGHIYPMMEACDEAGIRFIGCRHEMNAAFMAEGWALSTGKPGVCTGTAGPGTTNLITGVANAHCNMVPLLCVGGKGRVAEFDRNELQDFDTMSVMSKMVKYARQVPDGRRIPEYFGRALAESVGDRPGPVYLEVPRDRMEELYDEREVEFQENWICAGRPAADPEDAAAAAALINSAERPVAIVGGGAFWSGAADELREFIEKTDCPVFTRNAGRGIIPDSHPLAITMGASRHPVCASAIADSDLVMIIGTRTGYLLKKDAFPKGCRILRIDISGAAMTDQLDITLGLVGDVKEVLKQLIPLVEKADHAEWVQSLRDMRDNLMGFLGQAASSSQIPVHPLRLVSEIAKRVDRDTVMVIDGGDTASWGNSALPAMGPGQTLTIAGGSFGPLGVGVPYAIAAKLAHPGKKVMLLTGDGAFGYGAMEYDTCMRYGIKITTIILNDSCWGMIKNSEAKVSSPDKRFVELYLRDVRYDEVVKSMGCYGEYVEDPEEIGPAIDRALAQDLPAVVNVKTDVDIGFAF